MIGWIRGRLLGKRPPQLLLDVNGLGYELDAPMSTFYVLPELGGEVSLFTHQLVRDDAHQLFGFASENERDVFRQLLRVNGVGAKLALAILSGMDSASFSRCVHEGDVQALSRLPGIGKKTAERLIIEMRDRLGSVPASVESVAPDPRAGNGGEVRVEPAHEAISALVALGLKPQDASRRVHGLDCQGLRCEEIVRRALQTLVR